VDGANLIFHVGALLGILGLGFGYARLFTQRRLIRRMLRMPEPVVLAEPLAFTLNLAEYLGIPTVGNPPPKELPQRIAGRVVLEFLVRYRMKEIEAKGHGFLFRLSNSHLPPAELEQWREALSHALSCEVAIQSEKDVL
jgi:hypothetical protein